MIGSNTKQTEHFVPHVYESDKNLYYLLIEHIIKEDS